MRGVVWIVLLFAAAVVAATTLGPNDGLVSVFWQGWRTDFSLNLFVITLVGACLVLVAAAHAVARVLSLPRRAGEWRGLRRERAAQAALRDAMAEFYAARYGRARKAAEKALALADDASPIAADTEFRGLALLLAAASLHRLQDRAGRDEMLQRALRLVRRGVLAGRRAPGLEEGARLLAAEWALDDRDAARSLEALSALPPGVARRTQALRLRLSASRMAREPLQALHTARLLANHQAFSEPVAQSLLRTLACEVLDEARDIDQLRERWGRIEPADRADVVVLVRAAARAVQLGAPEQARAWLRPAWDRLLRPEPVVREEREALALALFDARTGIGNDWLPALEAGLQRYPADAAVQAAVGAAFAQCGLWGKSRALLEQAAAATALPARTRRACWRELARLAREDQDEARVARCEHAAAALD